MEDDREDLSKAETLQEVAIPGEKRISLSELGENRKARVSVIEGGRGVKARLSQIGIHPGDVVTVVRYGALKGPLVIEVHGFQLALGRGVASQILVEEVES